MDTKSPECFGTDPRARGLRVELSAQHSIVLPYEHFVWSELRADREQDTLRMVFVTHEIVVEGTMLRRIESVVQSRDLAWLAARPDRYRSQANERGYITRIKVRQLQEADEEAEPVSS